MDLGPRPLESLWVNLWADAHMYMYIWWLIHIWLMHIWHTDSERSIMNATEYNMYVKG